MFSAEDTYSSGSKLQKWVLNRNGSGYKRVSRMPAASFQSVVRRGDRERDRGDVSRMGWKAIQSQWSVTPLTHLSHSGRFSTVLTKPYVTLRHTNGDHLPITIHGLMASQSRSLLMKNLEWQMVDNYRWLYWIWLYFLRAGWQPAVFLCLVNK